MRRLVYLGWLFLVVTLVTLWSFVFWRVQRSEAEALERLERHTLDLALAFATHSRLSFAEIDYFLKEFRRIPLGDVKALDGIVARHQAETSVDAYQIGIGDASGHLVYSNISLPNTPVDISDREHFRYFSQGGADKLFINAPIKGRISGKWSIPLGRPVWGDGKFVGVAIYSVAPEYFTRLYSQVDLGRDGLVAMIRDDGAILARTGDATLYIGTYIKTSPWSDPGAPAHGSYRRVTQTDGRDRIFSYYRLPEFGVTITVGAGVDEALTPGRQELWSLMIVIGAFSLLLALMAVWIQRSIATRIKQGEALRANEHRLRKLSRAVEQSPNMIFVTDLDGVIEYVNPHFTVLSGYSAEEAIGQTPRLLKSGETPPEVYRELWRCILAGSEWRGELKDCAKDGRIFWASVLISPVRDEADALTYFVAMHEDITERKLAEEATRRGKEQAEMASRAKSEILTNMSHELRTPLNAVIGCSETLLAGVFGPPPNARFAEYINDIHDAGKHLLDVINDILDVSAIDAGRISLHEEPVCVRDAVEATIRLIAPRAEKGGVTVLDETPSDLPRLRADERRVKQIVLNMLSNAVKFTPRGGTVSVSACLTSAGVMEIAVTDTGIGMDDADIAKALTVFGQVDSGLSRTQEGTGLGLPLTKSLVELHGGTLDIASEKGVGTAVTAAFPAGRVEGGLRAS